MNHTIKKIILCFDNSDSSHAVQDTVLSLAGPFGSEVVGVHGYNATMHEGAFRVMEPTLPAQYQTEEILAKQRNVHTRLINVGMEKISLSYLKPLEDSFRSANVGFRAEVREGKNFRAVNDVIAHEGGDLIVIGSAGFNSNGTGFIGSVCLRVLRNNDRNVLIVRKQINFRNPKIVVGLDGSASSIAALQMARVLGDVFHADLHLVYAFDATLHKDIFDRLKESLINKEGFAFNSKEQEKIHDRFIDKGLARVGHMILERAEQEVFGDEGNVPASREWGPVGEGRPRVKRVLEGYIYKTICDYASRVDADLICLGRTGRHFVDDVDIGSVTENVVRFSPCSVLVTRDEHYRGWEV